MGGLHSIVGRFWFIFEALTMVVAVRKSLWMMVSIFRRFHL